MNTTKQLKTLGFFVLVVAVSLATNLVSNYIINKQSGGLSADSSMQVPTAYARFANASSAMETDFTVAAELSIDAVVHVKTKTPMQVQQFGFPNDPFFEYFFGRPQQPQSREPQMREGSGSGVIISKDGYIVTNNHVIDNSKEIEVTLNDKRTFKAKLIGADKNTDIALLKIEADNLPVILFGNSDSLKVGEWVLAVGNPFNLTSTVTAGIVSAKARNINILNASMKIESFIQTDAAVNPGNSGGALVNMRGELVGINTAIASQTGSFAGYAFAVPVSIVQKIVSDIRQYGVVQRAVLGVRMGDITSELAKEKNLKTMNGAYVDEVIENSAAQKAGVKSGDVIVGVNGVAIKSSSQLQEQIGRYSPGDKIVVEVLRNNKSEKLNVELKNLQGNTSVVSSNFNMNDALGATFKEITAKQKEQFRIEYGVQVESVSRGKLQQQGVRNGYVIVKINNQPIRTVEDMKSAVDAVMNSVDGDKVLFIAGVYPNGKVTYYAVNMAE